MKRILTSAVANAFFIIAVGISLAQNATNTKVPKMPPQNMVPVPAAEEPGIARLFLFDDAPTGGWSSQMPVVDAPIHSGHGAAALYLGNAATTEQDKQYSTGYSLHYLYSPEHVFTTRPFQSLVFYINGGPTGGQKFSLLSSVLGDDWHGHVRLNFFEQATKYLEGGLSSIPANRWVKVTIPLEDLGVANRDDFRGFNIDNVSEGKQGVFYVDDVYLEGRVPQQATVTVDATQPIRRVNDDVFGIATYGVARVPSMAKDETERRLYALDVDAARDAGYRLQRVFYPTFNSRPGMVPNIYQGLLFGEATGAQMMACVNYADMEADGVKVEKGRSFGTPQEAAAMFAYTVAPTDGAITAMVLGKDVYGRDWGTVGDWSRLRAGLGDGKIGGRAYSAMKVNHPAPFQVKYWELDNEPWMHGNDTDWLGYANYCKETAALMRKIEPTAKVGVTPVGEGGTPPHPEALNPKNGQKGDTVYYFLSGQDQKQSPGRLVPDFIVYHWYGGTDTGPSADLSTLLHYQNDTFKWPNVAKRLRRELIDFWGEADGVKPTFIITENNVRSTFPLNRQTHSLVAGLYAADDFAQLLLSREGDFEGLTWHDWDDGTLDKGGYFENPAMYGWRNEGGYGVYGSHQKEGSRTRYPVHYAFKLLSRYFAFDGDAVVPANSNTVMLQSYAVKQKNGNLAVLLINKSATTDIDVNLNVQGYKPATAATLYRYGKIEDRNEADITATPLSFNATQPLRMPAYSMTVVTLTTVGGTPQAPTEVTAQPGNAQIKLVWTAMSGATAYDVYRSAGNAAPQLLKSGIAATTFTDTTAKNGSEYAYQVAPHSSKSRSATVKAMPLTAPGAVAGLTAVGADAQIVLEWQPTAGATDYTVRRATSAKGPFAVVTTHTYKRNLDQTLSFTSCTDGRLQPGKTYYYQVSATNAGGEGRAALISATPTASVLGPWGMADRGGRFDGLTTYDARTGHFVLEGSGTAWYNSGEGRFVYKKLSGDGSVTAKISVMIGDGLYGKNITGVALADEPMRGGPNRYAIMGISPSYGAVLSTSTNSGAHYETEGGGVPAEQHKKAPYWVRLTRSGTKVTGYLSPDGQNWTEYNSSQIPDLPQDVYIGLLVNSMAYFANAHGEFDNVKLEGNVTPIQP